MKNKRIRGTGKKASKTRKKKKARMTARRNA